MLFVICLKEPTLKIGYRHHILAADWSETLFTPVIGYVSWTNTFV
jgi:hypothetical protein